MSVFGYEFIEVIPDRQTCSFEEFDHNRVTFSIVYKVPQILGLDIIRLVAKNIYVERHLIVHNDKGMPSCSCWYFVVDY